MPDHGELTTPLSTLPAISGLQRVGGKALVPLFCFDKPAFCSYGLKKSTNAPVSEEAFAVVKDALNDLLAGAPAMYRRDKNKDFNPSTPVYAGMMFLHWYDCQIEPSQDLILPAFEGFGGEDQDEDESLPLEEREEVDRQEEAQARARADQLVQSVSTGAQMPPLKTQYHILLISANSGRAVVRRYECGSYAELQKNLTKWNEEMALADRSGTSTLRPCKLFARLCRLIKDQEKHGAELYVADRQRTGGNHTGHYYGDPEWYAAAGRGGSTGAGLYPLADAWEPGRGEKNPHSGWKSLPMVKGLVGQKATGKKRGGFDNALL